MIRIWKVISQKLVRNSNVKTWLGYRGTEISYEWSVFVNFCSLRVAPATSSTHRGPIPSLGVLFSPCPSATSQLVSCCFTRILPSPSLSPAWTPPVLATPRFYFLQVPLSSHWLSSAHLICTLVCFWVWFYQESGWWEVNLKIRNKIRRLCTSTLKMCPVPCWVISNHLL